MKRNNNGERVIRLSTVIMLFSVIVAIFIGLLGWVWAEFRHNPSSTYYEKFLTKSEYDKDYGEMCRRLDKIDRKLDKIMERIPK